MLGISMLCKNHKIKSLTFLIFDKKIHSTLLICSKYKQPFKSISWSDSVEYYLVGPKIILMTLYSIFLQTINSLFPSLESSLHKISNFPHKQCLWYGEQDEPHSNFIL